MVSSSPVSSQNRSHYSSQHQKRTASGSAPQQHHLQNSFLTQNTSVEGDSLQQQQCLSQSLFDNSMFLLPSNTEESMPGCNSSGGNNFLQPSMSLYMQQPQQQQQQSSSKHYSSNPHQNYSMNTSKNILRQQQQQQQQQQHAEQQQQLVLPPISSGLPGSNPGSSYINFNLSTIFPEINFVNEKLAVHHGLLSGHPNPTASIATPTSVAPSPSKSSSSIPTSSGTASGKHRGH